MLEVFIQCSIKPHVKENVVAKENLRWGNDCFVQTIFFLVPFQQGNWQNPKFAPLCSNRTRYLVSRVYGSSAVAIIILTFYKLRFSENIIKRSNNLKTLFGRLSLASLLLFFSSCSDTIIFIMGIISTRLPTVLWSNYFISFAGVKQLNMIIWTNTVYPTHNYFTCSEIAPGERNMSAREYNIFHVCSLQYS